MASIHTLFEAILEATPGRKFVVRTANRNEHETIRTQLCKLWANHKTILGAIGDDDSPLLELALCADFAEHNTAEDNRATSTFYLGTPRRKVAKSFSFQIMEEQDDNGSNPPASQAE